MRSPQPPPWTARWRESVKSTVGARGTCTAGIVRCRQILLLLRRSYLVGRLVARFQVTTPIKVARHISRRSRRPTEGGVMALPQAAESYSR